MTTSAYSLLETQLHALHLAALLEGYHEQAQAAVAARWPYETYLATLIQQEVDRRSGNRLQRRIKDAHFPALKELADFDFAVLPHLHSQRVIDLAQGTYLDRAEPVLLVGAPGLGKTHVAIGLGLAACRQDRRVRFYTVTSLLNELQLAQQEHQLPRFLDRLLYLDLVILDEFGFVPFSPIGAQLLFQVCAALAEHVSMILTTNLPFGDWVRVLGDERLTAGLIDRLTFHSHILEFRGESYRFRLQRNAT